jgi:hypothetical protein
MAIVLDNIATGRSLLPIQRVGKRKKGRKLCLNNIEGLAMSAASCIC